MKSLNDISNYIHNNRVVKIFGTDVVHQVDRKFRNGKLIDGMILWMQFCHQKNILQECLNIFDMVRLFLCFRLFF